MATFPPTSATAKAKARPIPRAPPVIAITWSLSENNSGTFLERYKSFARCNLLGLAVVMALTVVACRQDLEVMNGLDNGLRITEDRLKSPMERLIINILPSVIFPRLGLRDGDILRRLLRAKICDVRPRNE